MTGRLAQNAQRAESNRERRKRMLGKYHRTFSESKDGQAVLEDLRAEARMLQGQADHIEFNNLTKPFSIERYFTRQGFRQAIEWIDWNLQAFEKGEAEDG